MPKTTALTPLNYPGHEFQRTTATSVVDNRFHGQRYWATIRKTFVDANGDGQPPLARMLTGRGGRGGETRLKVYLTLLWHVQPRHDGGGQVGEVEITKERLAKLVGIYKPDTSSGTLNAARDIAARDRIDRSLRWLADNQMIQRDKYSSRLRILDDAGTGEAYLRPGAVARAAAADKAKVRYSEKDHYFKIPAAFWTDGWIGAFSADELAAYLAILSALDFRKTFDTHSEPKPEWIWWSQYNWNKNIQLTRDMRYSGLNKLAKRRLVAKESQTFHSPEYNEFLTRRKYALIDRTLDGRVTPTT